MKAIFPTFNNKKRTVLGKSFDSILPTFFHTKTQIPHKGGEDGAGECGESVSSAAVFGAPLLLKLECQDPGLKSRPPASFPEIFPYTFSQYGATKVD